MAMSDIIIQLITALITIPLNGLLLMLTTMIFKVADQSYKTAIKVTAILGAIGFVIGIIGPLTNMPSLSAGLIIMVVQWVLVSILLALWLIKSNYQLDWGKTLLVWLVWFIMSIVAYFIIAMIVGVIAIGVLAYFGVFSLPAA